MAALLKKNISNRRRKRFLGIFTAQKIKMQKQKNTIYVLFYGAFQ